MDRILLVCCLMLAGCGSSGAVSLRPIELTGGTMGTTFKVLYVVPDDDEAPSQEAVVKEIEATLETVNAQMSNWREDSEISRFNESGSTDWFEVSSETAGVLSEAKSISKETGGAFDATVAPLIELWGFGPSGPKERSPSAEEIETVSRQTGWEKYDVRIASPAALKKQIPSLTVNLSAIAKGYGVDAVANQLEALGISSYLVEIGGEVKVRGKKPDGSKWSVGIEAPTATTRDIHKILSLTDAALATSGDYRNFVERDGKRYSHTIDPRTGRPIIHQLASVSVVAENCMRADALATAIMVMGPETGYNYAKEHDLPVLLLIHAGEGVKEQASPAWQLRFGGTP